MTLGTRLGPWRCRWRPPRPGRRLWRRDDGAVSVEFALLSLPFITVIVGFFELAIVAFLSTALEGASMEAARFGVTGSTDGSLTRSERVRQIIEDGTLGLLDSDDLKIETLVYDSFDNIGEPEPFTDDNGNGSYDDGETYTDVNGNGQWDPDMGAAGLGGPGSVVVYEIAYDWVPITPLMQPLLGTITLSTTVPVRNEPY